MLFPNTLVNHTVARQRCWTEGGELVGAYTPAENARLVEEFSVYPTTFSWIGLMSRNSVPTTDPKEYLWLSTKQTPNYTAWAPNEPNNGAGTSGICVHLVLKNVSNWGAPGSWHDVRCIDARAIACELGESLTVRVG